jgi:hypothetical protein
MVDHTMYVMQRRRVFTIRRTESVSGRSMDLKECIGQQTLVCTVPVFPQARNNRGSNGLDFRL